jgi:hypothetical protein
MFDTISPTSGGKHVCIASYVGEVIVHDDDDDGEAGVSETDVVLPWTAIETTWISPVQVSTSFGAGVADLDAAVIIFLNSFNIRQREEIGGSFVG